MHDYYTTSLEVCLITWNFSFYYLCLVLKSPHISPLFHHLQVSILPFLPFFLSYCTYISSQLLPRMYFYSEIWILQQVVQLQPVEYYLYITFLYSILYFLLIGIRLTQNDLMLNSLFVWFQSNLITKYAVMLTVIDYITYFKNVPKKTKPSPFPWTTAK